MQNQFCSLHYMPTNWCTQLYYMTQQNRLAFPARKICLFFPHGCSYFSFCCVKFQAFHQSYKKNCQSNECEGILSAIIKAVLSPRMKLPNVIMFCSQMSGGTLELVLQLLLTQDGAGNALLSDSQQSYYCFIFRLLCTSCYTISDILTYSWFITLYIY